MESSASQSFQSDPASPTSDTVLSVRLPIEIPASDFDEAIRELEKRPTEELRRARKHHRRALKALRNDAYEALPDHTRERLMKRFHANLAALNEVLGGGSGDGEVGR